MQNGPEQAAFHFRMKLRERGAVFFTTSECLFLHSRHFANFVFHTVDMSRVVLPSPTLLTKHNIRKANAIQPLYIDMYPGRLL
ncbi:hypothetical protein DQG13_25210 [Paenibacillus sp. YN15]|nr:hypothetical protein DQG13_25210 [Paenibacillus sp. YN15]